MNIIVAGGRPRPRVAYIGSEKDASLARLRDVFPTWWQADRFDLLPEKVDYRELDLIIVGPDAAKSPHGTSGGTYEDIHRQYRDNAHLISFSSTGLVLPGPLPGTLVHATGKTTTEERVLPQTVTLSFNRQRSDDLARTGSSRGWLEYSIVAPSKTLDEARKNLEEGALILNPHTQKVLAAIYMRKHCNLGVAVFPAVFNLLEWVPLVVQEWANNDQERFPGFADWHQHPVWMVPEEIKTVQAIAKLEQEKSQTISKIDQRILELNNQLTAATLTANQGLRRLLTHQGNDLVDEVASVFEEFGFHVADMDPSLPDGSPKREDLRLGISEDNQWCALVEVRGYTASAGKTSDLQRLTRFASMYLQETGRMPDQLIYVVNGQIDIRDPSRREDPLAASPEDTKIFSENSGLIISTLDLFRVVNMLGDKDIAEVREEIRQARGRWRPID